MEGYENLNDKLSREGTISPAAAAEIMEVEPQIVVRLATKGIKVNGEVVQLEAARFGGRYRTSLPAIRRFQAISNPHITRPQVVA